MKTPVHFIALKVTLFSHTYYTPVKSVNPRVEPPITSEAAFELWVTLVLRGDMQRMNIGTLRCQIPQKEAAFPLCFTSTLCWVNEEQSMVTVTNQSQLWKQAFSWLLIFLLHLSLLCLSSTSSVPLLSSLFTCRWLCFLFSPFSVSVFLNMSCIRHPPPVTLVLCYVAFSEPTGGLWEHMAY